MMFEELDDAEGTPIDHGGPGDAKRRAGKMQLRRRALAMAAVAVVALPLALTVGNLNDHDEGSLSTFTSPTTERAEKAPDTKVDPSTTEVPPATSPTTTSESTTTTSEVAPPTTPSTEPAPVGPPETSAPPTTEEYREPEINPDDLPVLETLQAHLMEDFDSGASGHAIYERTPAGWRISIELEGLVPNLDHSVTMQYDPADFSQLNMVCQGRSDASGAFSCISFIEERAGSRPASVSVGGYVPEQDAYRAVAHGDLE